MQPNRWAGFIRGLAAIGLLTGVVSLTDQVQAASGNGPYYAEPAWSQKFPAATRFVVLTDWNSEAVLDRSTGLVWEKSPDVTPKTWIFAKSTCLNRKVGGQMGWRLPAIGELASLVDPSVQMPGPTLPSGHPFTNVQSSLYWSVSPIAEFPTLAWVALFNSGDVGNSGKTDPRYVWCVRGGNGADQY